MCYHILSPAIIYFKYTSIWLYRLYQFVIHNQNEDKTVPEKQRNYSNKYMYIIMINP